MTEIQTLYNLLSLKQKRQIKEYMKSVINRNSKNVWSECLDLKNSDDEETLTYNQTQPEIDTLVSNGTSLDLIDYVI